MEDKSRMEWIDLLRVMAILFVVLCHCTEEIYGLNIAFMSSLGLKSKAFAFLAYSVGRLGVPIFLMISGYLLLDREYNAEKTKLFWKNNWLHLLICTYIWMIIYNFLETVVNGTQIYLTDVLKEMLFLQHSRMPHIWYMPTLLGIYLLVPFIANGLRALESRVILFPVVIFFLYIFGHPFLDTIMTITGKGHVSQMFFLGFSGGYYGAYFIVGYLVKKGLLKKIESWFLILTSFAALIFMAAFQFWAYSRGYSYNAWYDNLFLLIGALGIFEVCSRMKHIPFYELINLISLCAFGIYLVHYMMIYLAVPRILGLGISRPIQVGILWGVTLLCSLVVVWIIRCIPKIGKYIMYMK